MRRWIIDRHGGESLRIDEAPCPVPLPGEVLVRVSAVALNARDPMMMENGMGLALQFPFLPGSDMAGVVERVGANVDRFDVGDRVISNFLPEWIDGRPGGSASEPSYRTLGAHFPGVLAEFVSVPQACARGRPHDQPSIGDVVRGVLATGGRGADHVLELVGGENFAHSVAAVSVAGRISVIGLLGGEELTAPTTPILLKAPLIQGIVTEGNKVGCRPRM